MEIKILRVVVVAMTMVVSSTACAGIQEMLDTLPDPSRADDLPDLVGTYSLVQFANTDLPVRTTAEESTSCLKGGTLAASEVQEGSLVITTTSQARLSTQVIAHCRMPDGSVRQDTVPQDLAGRFDLTSRGIRIHVSPGQTVTLDYDLAADEVRSEAFGARWIRETGGLARDTHQDRDPPAAPAAWTPQDGLSSIPDLTLVRDTLAAAQVGAVTSISSGQIPVVEQWAESPEDAWGSSMLTVIASHGKGYTTVEVAGHEWIEPDPAGCSVNGIPRIRYRLGEYEPLRPEGPPRISVVAVPGEIDPKWTEAPETIRERVQALQAAENEAALKRGIESGRRAEALGRQIYRSVPEPTVLEFDGPNDAAYLAHLWINDQRSAYDFGTHVLYVLDETGAPLGRARTGYLQPVAFADVNGDGLDELITGRTVLRFEESNVLHMPVLSAEITPTIC